MIWIVVDELPMRIAMYQYAGRVLRKLAEAGFDPVYGARPLKRAIQQELENPLSKAILKGSFGPKDTIEVDVAGSELGFRKVA